MLTVTQYWLGDGSDKFFHKYYIRIYYVNYGHDRMVNYCLEKGDVHRTSAVFYERKGSSVSLQKSSLVDWAKALKDSDWFNGQELRRPFQKVPSCLVFRLHKWRAQWGLWICEKSIYESIGINTENTQ